MDAKTVLFLGAGLAGTLISPAQKPNILLVVSDDHSAAHLGCYGNPDVRTPYLDDFARQGVRFARAYCASPQSVPSRAAIMTGRSPVAVDMTRFNVTLDREFKTFPEYLRKAGYYVGVAGRGYHLDGTVDGVPGKIKEVEEYYLRNHYKTFPERLDTCMVIPDSRKGKNHVLINRQFFEFMDKRDPNKPFFLQLSYSDPHRPYDAPKVHDPSVLTLPAHYPDTRLVREDLAAYYDEIHRMDTDFGEILRYLQGSGLERNTIVVFTGDNGAAQFMGKGTLYEYGINVPLIFRWPGHYPEGKVIDRIASNEDLAPTFLSAAGIPVPEEMTGTDLSGILLGQSEPDREYVFSVRSCHATNSLPHTTAVFDQMRCVIGQRYKLIYTLLPGLRYVPIDFARTPMFQELKSLHEQGTLAAPFDRLYFPEKRPMFELFDLANDPGERQNLIDRPEYAAIQRELILALTYRMIRDRDFVTLPHPKLYE